MMLFSNTTCPNCGKKIKKSDLLLVVTKIKTKVKCCPDCIKYLDVEKKMKLSDFPVPISTGQDKKKSSPFANLIPGKDIKDTNSAEKDTIDLNKDISGGASDKINKQIEKKKFDKKIPKEDKEIPKRKEIDEKKDDKKEEDKDEKPVLKMVKIEEDTSKIGDFPLTDDSDEPVDDTEAFSNDSIDKWEDNIEDSVFESEENEQIDDIEESIEHKKQNIEPKSEEENTDHFKDFTDDKTDIKDVIVENEEKDITEEKQIINQEIKNTEDIEKETKKIEPEIEKTLDIEQDERETTEFNEPIKETQIKDEIKAEKDQIEKQKIPEMKKVEKTKDENTTEKEKKEVEKAAINLSPRDIRVFKKLKESGSGNADFLAEELNITKEEVFDSLLKLKKFGICKEKGPNEEKRQPADKEIKQEEIIEKKTEKIEPEIEKTEDVEQDDAEEEIESREEPTEQEQISPELEKEETKIKSEIKTTEEKEESLFSDHDKVAKKVDKKEDRVKSSDWMVVNKEIEDLLSSKIDEKGKERKEKSDGKKFKLPFGKKKDKKKSEVIKMSDD